MTPPLKIIIVGGVAAGPAAAARARRTNSKAHVILIEQGAHISYGTCDLPYFISGVIREERALIAYTPAQLQQDKGVDVRTRQRVEKIRPAQKKLLIRDLTTNALTEESYSRLILATGSTARQPFPELNDCPNFFTLKTLPDAQNIRAYLHTHQPRRVTILGAGFIALELVETFRHLGLAVTVIHQEELPAPGFEDVTRHIVLDKLAEQQVRYVGDADVTGFERDAHSGRIQAIRTCRGDVETELVVMAWGFVPRVELAQQAGIRLGRHGGMTVDQHMRTSVDGIYACGDCVELKHHLTDRPAYVPLATYAAKTARVAADNAVGTRAVFKGMVGTIGFRFFDLELARTGLTAATAQAHGFQPVAKTITEWSHAHVLPGAEKMAVTLLADRRSGQLLGGEIVGKQGAALRINPLAVALQAKMSVADVARTDFLYTPPFAPLWDPVLRCAMQLEKAVGTRF